MSVHKKIFGKSLQGFATSRSTPVPRKPTGGDEKQTVADGKKFQHANKYPKQNSCLSEKIGRDIVQGNHKIEK